jgi:hypothetical protein
MKEYGELQRKLVDPAAIAAVAGSNRSRRPRRCATAVRSSSMALRRNEGAVGGYHVVDCKDLDKRSPSLRIPTLRVGGAVEVRRSASTVHAERSAA